MKKALLALLIVISTTSHARTSGECERDIVAQMLNLRKVDSKIAQLDDMAENNMRNKHSASVTHNLIYTYIHKLAKAVCD